MKRIFICCIIMSAILAPLALGSQENTSGTTDRAAGRLRIESPKKGVEIQQEKRAGSIEQVRGKDIFVRHADINKPFLMGEKLHLVIDGKSITLEVTFPMQTSSRCRIAAGDTGKPGQIRKGMAVYAGEKAPEVKAEVKPEDRAGNRIDQRRLRSAVK